MLFWSLGGIMAKKAKNNNKYKVDFGKQNGLIVLNRNSNFNNYSVRILNITNHRAGKGFSLDIIIDLYNQKLTFRVHGKDCCFYPIEYTPNSFKPNDEEAQKKALEDLKKETDEKTVKCLNDQFFKDLEQFMVEHYFDFRKNDIEISKKVKSKPTSVTVLMEFSEALEEAFDIVKTVDDNGNATLYYKNKDSYEVLDISVLTSILNEKYGLRLPKRSKDDILSSMPNIVCPNEYLWEFKNGYLDTKTYEFKQFKKPQITPKKVGFIKGNDFHKVDYDPNVQLLSENLEEATFVEQTLRQILIPKYNPEDTAFYINFLQLLGACRIPNNIHKLIIEYNGSGNDGKTTLSALMNITFGDYFIGTTGESMKKDMFNASYIGNKHIIIIDEITSNSLNGIWDTIKRISSGVNNTSSRGAYAKKPTKDIKYGILFIFSNVSPDLSYADEAVLSRYNILQMPNKFVNNPQEDNEYPRDDNILQKLAGDTIGLEWLINASIKAYMECKGDFKCKQTAEETKQIFLEGDDMTRFLNSYTRLSKDNRTTASDLADGFITFANAEDINLEARYKSAKDIKLAISKEIGSKLPQIYDPKDLDKGMNEDRKKDYAIELTAYV